MALRSEPIVSWEGEIAKGRARGFVRIRIKGFSGFCFAQSTFFAVNGIPRKGICQNQDFQDFISPNQRFSRQMEFPPRGFVRIRIFRIKGFSGFYFAQSALFAANGIPPKRNTDNLLPAEDARARRILKILKSLKS